MTTIQRLRSKRNECGIAILAGALAAVATGILFPARAQQSELATASGAASLAPTGAPQPIAAEPLTEAPGQMCQWSPASASASLRNLLAQESSASPASADAQAEKRDAPEVVDRAPSRVIHDSYATYSAVAVDTQHNEIVLQDENLFRIAVFNRLDNTPKSAALTEPKRIIGGRNTKIEFNCGLYIDPETGDIYSVPNDTMDTLVIFSRDAQGNVPPTRELSTPHGTYGIAVDESKQEMYLTVEHDNALVVYRKGASGKDSPVRFIQGDHTGLADPHGIALDMKDGLIFVSNHGSFHRDAASATAERPSEGQSYGAASRQANLPLSRESAVPGSGKIFPPSISVYPMAAAGDTAPLRVIQGPKTQMNWPANMYMDQDRGELYVANDGGDSVLVFHTADNGDVAPSRVIQGPKTGLKNPTGVFVDTKNNELVVSNMGNHSATVFSRAATGDVAPLRTIRSSPEGKVALAIGNPGGVAYDSKRNEILVPN